MFTRLFVAITLLGTLLGQMPRSVTICLCTGQLDVASVEHTEVCTKHAPPPCSKCKPAKSMKRCFVTKTSDAPLDGITSHYVPIAPMALPTAFILPEPLTVPVFKLPPHLVLPRIREPDQSGHPLRAPPFLA